MSITSSNATILLTVRRLFPVPVQIQGFATDDVFSTEPLKSAETMRGVDGKLSGGFVYSDIRQNFALQADSPSIAFFDQWALAQSAQGDTYEADGVILLTSLGKKWTMTKGFLVGYPIIPDAKKLLQPVRFAIEWESLAPSAS